MGEAFRSRRVTPRPAFALRRDIVCYDTVNALFAGLLGDERQAELFAHHPGQEAADRVGLPAGRIDAPWVFDGPINAESFRLYVEEVLVAALKPGDIVVLDNLGSHKGKTIRDVIRAAGARLFFLPPYSPDLNPIEQVFAKLKHSLRKAAKRTVEATWRQIGALLDDFSPEECQRYLVNAGYGST